MKTKTFNSRLLPALWLLAMSGFFIACAAQTFYEPEPARASSGAAKPRTETRGANPAAPGAAIVAHAAQATAAVGHERGDAARLERGRVLFANQCVICHGESGDGAGPFAYLMNPRPRDLRKGVFKLASTQNLIPSDDDLLRTISRGMPGSAMPPWGHLPQEDLFALVAYVRQLHVDAVRAQLQAGVRDGTYDDDEVAELLAERTQPGPPIVIPPEPGFDDLRWFNGRRVYMEACAACHGPDGHPLPEAVKFDDAGFPVPPRSFVNGIFKGGMDGAALYSRITKGMPGTPMPAFEGIYSDDDLWDLIHYTQSLARAGSQDRAQLRQGSFTASRVKGRLPADPRDEAWKEADSLFVALTPLWWADEHIDGLVVQAMHDGEEIALRFMWQDPSRDDRAVQVGEFRDAVAIQFSLTDDPPFYMGAAGDGGGVNIWMWKADRQTNIASGYQDVDAAFPDRAVDMYDESSIRSDDMSKTDWPTGDISEHNPTYITAWGAGNLVADPNLKTPVECLTARGPGTLAGKPPNVQLVQGSATYERGMWMVVVRRSMASLQCAQHAPEFGDERVFKSGDVVPVSFAIWNGSAHDRDGQKNISIWQKLVME